MKTKQDKGHAYGVIETIYRKSPGCPGTLSWRDLNPSLSNALQCCVTAKIPFLPKEVEAIYHDFKGAYWFGDSGGSPMPGEWIYTLACAKGHTSACVSYEQYAGRPAVYWEAVGTENGARVDRVHVGYEFVWKGYAVKVTSMRETDLVACHYGPYTHDRMEVAYAVGSVETCYLKGGYRGFEVRGRREVRGDLVVTLRECEAEPRESREVKKRFTLSYAEMEVALAKARTLVRLALKEIEKAKDEEATGALRDQLQARIAEFRHFDRERLAAALNKRVDVIRKAKEDAERERRDREEREQWERDRPEREARQREQDAKERKEWLAGKGHRGYFPGPVQLRLKNGMVETTNGQLTELENVQRVLPAVLAAAGVKETTAAHIRLDEHTTITAFSPEGVQAGCKLISWAEVKRIAKVVGKGGLKQ